MGVSAKHNVTPNSGFSKKEKRRKKSAARELPPFRGTPKDREASRV